MSIHGRSRAVAAAIALMALFSLGAAAVSFDGGAAGQTAGGMELLAIDMNVAGNSATVLGARQECAESQPGDSVTVDVTATGIPSATAMIAYAYTLQFDAPGLAIIDQEPLMILARQGSSMLNASDSLPATEGSVGFSVVDLSATVATSESGSGTLDRLTMEVATDAAPGIYTLSLSSAAHIDLTNTPLSPQFIGDARLAVGVPCTASTPIPTHTPAVPGTTATETTSPSGFTPTATPDGPAGSSSPTPGASITLAPGSSSPTPQPSGPAIDGEGDDGDGLSMALIVAVAAVGVAVAVSAWFGYRRWSSRRAGL